MPKPQGIVSQAQRKCSRALSCAVRTQLGRQPPGTQFILLPVSCSTTPFSSFYWPEGRFPVNHFISTYRVKTNGYGVKMISPCLNFRWETLSHLLLSEDGAKEMRRESSLHSWKLFEGWDSSFLSLPTLQTAFGLTDSTGIWRVTCSSLAASKSHYVLYARCSVACLQSQHPGAEARGLL